ncbi:MAG: M23 family metallopeptidase [Nostocoides sp.]
MSGVKAAGGIAAVTLLAVGACTAVMGAGGAGLVDQATGCSPTGPAIVQAGATGGPSTPPPAAADNGSGKLPTKVGIYQGVQLVNAGYVIKAGQALGLDSWTITVGVMTTMGESNLTVLDRGDAAGPDSRGLWQQRDNGAWGTLADRMDPTISSINGFTALMAVPGYRSLPPTIAAHRAQGNSNENYYAPFWPDAVAVVAALTRDPSLLTSLPASGTSVVGTDGAECVDVQPAAAARTTGGKAISGKWANPLKPAKYTLTSNFGDYRPNLRTAKLHKGQDLAAPGGTPIFSVCDGVTVQAGPVSGGGGNQTTIDCGGGVLIKLMHQSAITTTVGATLTAGEEIGKVGTTGNSTGDHLHEQVEINGVPINPVPFMAQHGVPL